MKYTFDLASNALFVQIIGVTETGKSLEKPFAFQVRADFSLLIRMSKLVQEVIDKIEKIDEDFHKSKKAKADFEQGVVVFKPGEVPLTCLVHRRQVYLSIAGRSVGDGPMNIVEFHRDLSKFINKETKRQGRLLA